MDTMPKPGEYLSIFVLNVFLTSHYILVPLLALLSLFLSTVIISNFSTRSSLHSSHGGLFDPPGVQARDSKRFGDEHRQSHLWLQPGRVNVHCWHGHQADDAGVPEKKALQCIHRHVLARLDWMQLHGNHHLLLAARLRPPKVRTLLCPLLPLHIDSYRSLASGSFSLSVCRPISSFQFILMSSQLFSGVCRSSLPSRSSSIEYPSSSVTKRTSTESSGELQ